MNINYAVSLWNYYFYGERQGHKSSEQPVHYRPGTGSIPENDWKLLFQKLQENRFSGTGVIEIQPRNPLQLAALSMQYLNRLAPTKGGVAP